MAKLMETKTKESNTQSGGGGGQKQKSDRVTQVLTLNSCLSILRTLERSNVLLSVDHHLRVG